jgi:hypothetical protein
MNICDYFNSVLLLYKVVFSFTEKANTIYKMMVKELLSGAERREVETF